MLFYWRCVGPATNHRARKLTAPEVRRSRVNRTEGGVREWPSAIYPKVSEKGEFMLARGFLKQSSGNTADVW